MITTKTPYRISFFGGGTDIPDFYRNFGGAVVSTAINKYMYVTVHQKFDGRFRIIYSQNEEVDTIDEIRHPIVRESLKFLDISRGLEIFSMADVPSGTGLGSSSTYAVGLLHALHQLKGELVDSARLAREACEIEIDKLGEPIGKQDQYAAAFGGFNYIRFNEDDTVFVEKLNLSSTAKRDLEERLLLLYTNTQRSAGTVLTEQKKNIKSKEVQLRRMREMAEEGRSLLKSGDVVGFGELLDQAWQYKKGLASGISNGVLDKYYETAKAAGAIGGKIPGAGGGGFLLLFCEPDKKNAVRASLPNLKEYPIRIERRGSQVIFMGENGNGGEV